MFLEEGLRIKLDDNWAETEVSAEAVKALLSTDFELSLPRSVESSMTLREYNGLRAEAEQNSRSQTRGLLCCG